MGRNSSMHFTDWDPQLLINFITQHHDQVKETIPPIKELLDELCNTPGNENNLLLTVREDFKKLSIELLNHLPNEEKILFGAIRKLYTLDISTCDIHIVRDRLDVLIPTIECEHDRAETLIKSIRVSTNNYEPPSFTCPTLKMTYVMLNQFDSDLMHRIHLENNVLLPKVKGQRKRP